MTEVAGRVGNASRQTVPDPRGGRSRVAAYARLVKIEHTGFALPFAVIGLILASFRYPVVPLDLVWIGVAFTAARFAAMGFNRIVDREYDARNPRTAGREIPSGRLTVREAKAAVGVASAVFVGAAGMLNPLSLALSPVALVAIFGYSYAKRYTAWTHLLLGVADGIAPAAGYLAISGEWSDPWTLLPLLVVIVGSWIGGFDILYSLQDIEADRRLGLHSVPARFGPDRARLVSAASHLITVAGLVALPVLVPELGAWYVAGLFATVALLGLEHGLVDPTSSGSIRRAFFTINVWLASVLSGLVLLDRLL